MRRDLALKKNAREKEETCTFVSMEFYLDWWKWYLDRTIDGLFQIRYPVVAAFNTTQRFPLST